jgi:hypothetical protein
VCVRRVWALSLPPETPRGLKVEVLKKKKKKKKKKKRQHPPPRPGRPGVLL